MNKSYSDKKARFGIKWIKSSSGNSYLCPVGTKISKDASDDELRRLCVEESNNPENA